MAERGIPFSADMVRAEQRGLKTHTRRVITPKWARCLDLDDPEDRARAVEQCPYGVPGDRLYVREPLRPRKYRTEEVSYDADGTLALRAGEPVVWPWKARYIASRYCPKWAARTWLEVTEVRVERVQDISEADASAEGVTAGMNEHSFWTARQAFAGLWDSINGARPGCSWAANPWVWVVAFRRVEA